MGVGEVNMLKDSTDREAVQCTTCALCLHSLTRSPTGGAYSYTSRENVMPEVLEFTVIDIMHAKIFKKKQI